MVKSISVFVFILASFLIPGRALAHKKMFPANRDSVLLENRYADTAGILRLSSLDEVSRAAETGVLVPIPITVSPKLPSERRYVRPAAHDFLLELDSRFYLTTGHFLIVDSAVRPVSVQRRLCRQNRSAAPATGERASSHERGTTFDLAKSMAANNHVDRMKKAQYRWLLTLLGYYQAIGRIHIIEERACIHIMVREDSNVDIRDARVVQAENLVGSESSRDELHSVQAFYDDRRGCR